MSDIVALWEGSRGPLGKMGFGLTDDDLAHVAKDHPELSARQLADQVYANRQRDKVPTALRHAAILYNRGPF